MNFLVYAPFARLDDESNYLADIAHYASFFSADRISIIAKKLGISSSHRVLLDRFSKFFNADSRIEKFHNLGISDYSEENIILGILAVLCGSNSLTFDNILREVIVSYVEDENKILNSFKNYDIDTDFWNIIKKEYGYDNESISEFLNMLLINYTSSLFEGKIISSWNKYLVENNNHRVFVDNFMNNAKYSDVYDQISKNVENNLSISTCINDCGIESYINCDTFEVFDINIISHYINLLNDNKEKIKDLSSIINERKKTHFYQKYSNEYQLLYYANLFIGLIKDFEKEELPDNIEDIVNIFARKWTYIDMYYRKFYYFYNRIEDTSTSIRNLRKLIENMYTQMFLYEINTVFTEKLAQQPLNDINIDKQWDFYENNIIESAKRQRTVVIISDAFRYGSAIELYEKLENDPKKTVTIKPLLSSIPSYTALGMACLLPHKTIKYQDEEVLIDGCKCSTTAQRDKILKSYNEKSIALTYDNVSKMSRDELQDTFSDKKLIYIYHNQIDAIGDHSPTENKVFNATEEAIDEIDKLITKLKDRLSISKFYITADHGFIYKEDKIKEKDKITINNTSLIKNKRYILSEDKISEHGIISLSMSYLGINDLYVNIPLGVDIFKSKGSGVNFVHGGGSLQECIIPQIEVKTEKGRKNQEQVSLELVSINNKITNYTFELTFYQKENISNKVLPLEAGLYFIDENGRKISNEVIIYADINSSFAEDREFREKFTLRREKYQRQKDYYLIIKDLNTDDEIYREKFMIDVI